MKKRKKKRQTRRHRTSQRKRSSHPRRGRSILIDAAKGAFFVLLVMLLTLGVEKTNFGEQMELSGYNLIQSQLRPGQIPLILVDISNLKTSTIVQGNEVFEATPREELKKIIDALVDQKPTAIGIDIDFSPAEDGGYKTPGDPEFFEFCLERSKKVPIRLGVYQNQSVSPELWLGSEGYKELPAAISTSDGDNRTIPITIRPPGAEEAGLTMSAALAYEYLHKTQRNQAIAQVEKDEPHDKNANGSHDQPSTGGFALPHWIAEPYLSMDYGDTGEAKEVFVDFSPLATLQRENSTIRPGTADVIRARGALFKEKLVLIGDAALGQTQDTFLPPGGKQQLPRIYLHASAIYTLTAGPLLELTGRGRLLVDLLLSLAVIFGVTLVRWHFRRHPREVATHRLERVFIFLIGVSAILVGVVLVRFTRVMWTDFILVVGALFLHPTVEHYAKSFWRLIRSRRAPTMEEMVFQGKEERH